VSLAVIFSVIASFLYAFQSTLLAKEARRISPLLVTAWRGVSLMFTMSPFLLFVPKEFFDSLNIALHKIILASVLTVFGNWAHLQSFRYLPVALAMSFCLSFSTLFGVFFSWLLLNESLDWFQGLWLVFVLIFVIVLGYLSEKKQINESIDIYRGIKSSLIFGFFLGISFILIGSVSRTSHPILCGYLWESLIGIFSLIIYIIREKEIPTLNNFRSISIRSLPTAPATALFAFATTLGSMAIIQGLMPLNLVWSAILGRFISREILSRKQIFFLILLFIALVFFSIH